MRKGFFRAALAGILVSVSLVSIVHAAPPGAAASWSFDSVSTTTYYDVTGNGYDAVDSGAAVGTAAGVVGQALSCQGNGYRIPIANSTESFAFSRFSVEAWINTRVDPATTSGGQMIFGYQAVTSGVRNGFSFYINPSAQINFGLSNGSGSAWETAVSSALISPNRWYHVVCTYDSAALRVYVNGALSGSYAYAGTYALPHAKAYIGEQTRPGGTADYYFNGLIDEVKYYSYALTADTVLAHYNGVLQPPVLSSPSDGATNLPLATTMSWSSVPGATAYNFQVATVSSFSPLFSTQAGLAGTTGSISGLAGNTTYYWRASASSSGKTGPWSAVFRFTTTGPLPQVPTLAAPANGSGGQPLSSLNLIWNTASGAIMYAYQVSTASSFSSLVAQQGSLGTTTSSISGLTSGTTYYWRVNATNTSGSSAWSEAWSFTTTITPPGAPQLSSPANGTTGQPVASTLYWSAATGAATYTVILSTSAGFGTTVLRQSGVTQTSLPVSNLANSTTYYWEVGAANAGGAGNWSSVWSFTTAALLPPAAPGLSAPANGSSAQPNRVTFYWGAASGAASYALQVSTNSAFSTTVINHANITATSSQEFFGKGISYFWRVSASNAGGTGAWSSTWSFGVAVSALPMVDGSVRPRTVVRNGVLTFSLPQSSRVRLSLVDLSGRSVLAMDEPYGPGNFRLSLNRPGLPRGIYLLDFRSAGAREKMTVLLGGQ